MHQAARPNDPQLEARIQSFELAYRMQTEATDAFDVTPRAEARPRRLRPRRRRPGSILIARRLVERGVRFVQVWHGPVQPWDSHDDLEVEPPPARRARCDQAIAALLTDLKRLGLFEETLGHLGRRVRPHAGGRAAARPGRTPARSTAATTTTGASPCWLAGGGVKGGQAVGATDEFGFKAVENPVHVHDLHATILHLLGFDHEKLTYRYAGRDFRLTDVHGQVVKEVLA